MYKYALVMMFCYQCIKTTLHHCTIYMVKQPSVGNDSHSIHCWRRSMLWQWHWFTTMQYASTKVWSVDLPWFTIVLWSIDGKASIRTWLVQNFTAKLYSANCKTQLIRVTILLEVLPWFYLYTTAESHHHEESNNEYPKTYEMTTIQTIKFNP